MHAGESQGTLKAAGSIEVLPNDQRRHLGRVIFISRRSDELPMVAQDAQAASAFKPERGCRCQGLASRRRALPVTGRSTHRAASRLIEKSVQASAANNDSNIQLADAGELPQERILGILDAGRNLPPRLHGTKTSTWPTGDETSATS